ncbi:hypothetical protein JCM10213_008198 [Rhodosporidiobolus nylandii]
MHARPPLPIILLTALLAIAAAPDAAAHSVSSLTRVPRHLDSRQCHNFFGIGCPDDSTSSSVSVPAVGASGATSATSSSARSTGTSGSSAAASSSGTSTPASAESSETSSASSSSAPSAPSSAPSEAASSSSSTKSSSVSHVIVTVTSILTNADGSQSTMLSASASAVPAKSDASSGGGGGPSGKTWGIIGGVVGGVVLLAGIVLVGWRLTQRRFSDLDNVDELRWPDLQPDGQTVSPGLTTLNPAGTKRTGGAGFEMEKDLHDEDGGSEWGGSPRVNGGAGYEVPYGGQAGGQRGSYYDPYPGTAPPPNDAYLGPSAAPYPPPSNIYPPHPAAPPMRSASPYMYGNTAHAASASFSNPHLPYPGSSEDVTPLTGGQGIPYRGQAASPRPGSERMGY